MSKPVFVVSDLHLGAVPPRTEERFADFLAHVRGGGSELLINGDLFDFWFEYRTVIPRRHFRTLARLADLVDSGVPVSLVAGNHDAWGGDVLRSDVGITLLEGPEYMELAGRRTLVAHGDGVGRGDLGYRVLRRVIRSRPAVRGFRALHPDLGSRIAGLASTTDAKAAEGRTEGRSRAGEIVRWASEQLKTDPALDLVVAGHSHVPALVEVFPGRFYANAGDWINHFTYLVLAEDRPPELREWPLTG